MAIPIVEPLVQAVVSAVPGKMEKMFRKDIIADRARLAGGGGGLSSGRRAQLASEASGQIQAQQGAALANLARGSAMGGGASGLAQAAAAGIQQAGLQATNQAMSDIRQQDLQVAEAQRQQLYQRMLAARQMGQQRKQEAQGSIGEVSNTGFQTGQFGRTGAATDISAGTGAMTA